MAQTGFTPIKLYSSSTAAAVPLAANLAPGELAINTADGKLFYEDSSGVVQVIASKAGNVNVASFSAGTTGFTPSTATTGAVTLAGTLALANGGTNATSAPAAMASLMGYTSTATAAGTTTLTNTSSFYQQFTGATTQTVALPVTSTLTTGWTFHIVNNSTGNVTVNSSGANLVITVLPGTTAMCTCILASGTTAASWEAGLTDFSTATGTGAVVLGTSPTITTPTLTFSTAATVTAGTNAQGQGALTNDYNVVTTAAANPSGVTLPTATVGRRIVIVNKGANPVNVYPASGGAIDALAANAAISLPVGGTMEFNASTTTLWYSTYNLYTTSAGYATTATAAGTTTLTSLSGYKQYFTGSTTQTVVLPVVTTLLLGRSYEIVNNSTGALTVNSSGGNSISTIPAGMSAVVTCIAITGTTATSWHFEYTSYDAITGTGAAVFADSPALVTPDLGTPSALVGTNITGTASGLTAGNVTTNANLTGDVTSVGNATTLTNAPVIAKVLTGYVSGAGVVAATDSILQAIQKLDGNDATNANLTGAVTSVGNATSLGSFSSANLRTALTDETGTGVAVFGTSPAITTSLTTGSATFALLNTTATTINIGGAATAVNVGAATGTLTVANTTLAAKAITASTTLGVTGVSTLTGGAVVQGLTVGLGGGAIASNTAFGLNVLADITTGSGNTAIGWQSSQSMDVASDNTTYGLNTLRDHSYGDGNVAVGSQAMQSSITCSGNTAIGTLALVSGTAVIGNVAVGYAALRDVTGNSNVGVGNIALRNASGSNNVAIGDASGQLITTGSYNVVIGGYSGLAAPISETGSNWIVLSDGAGNVRQALDATSVQSLTGAAVVYAPAPAATISAATTLTNAQILPQIVVTSGTSFTLTMPIGTTLETLVSWAGIDLGFNFTIINTASGTITLDATETGVTSVGTMTVLTGISATFRIRRTAANTFIVYRV